MIKLKLVYQENVRKFQLSAENVFTNVQLLVKEMIQDKFVPTLLYLDEDEDWITISTESDLLLCLQSISTPKIHILPANERNTVVKDRDDGRWERQTGRSMTDTSVKAVNGDDDDFKVEVSNLKGEIADEFPMTQEDNVSSIDWNALVEDFLARASDPLLNLVKEVAQGVMQKKDFKTLVPSLADFPFNDHLFFQKSTIDFEKMLETVKVNPLTKFISQVGLNGLDMAIPILLRGYAKMKANESNGAGPAFPRMVAWFEAVVARGNEAIFEFDQQLNDMKSDQRGEAPHEAKAGEANPAANEITIHDSVRCDICKTIPIIGTRYKCMTCLNFDMCETCKTGNHPPEHPLITLLTPVPKRGYKLGGGHLEGATEFLMPGWNQCKKRGTLEPTEKSAPVPATRGHGCRRGFRGKGRRRHRGGWRQGGGPPFGYHHHGMHGPFRYRPEPVLPDDFEDTDSSFSSSSSSEDSQKLNKLSGKKLKKQQRKLKKKERKVRHKISKLLQTQGKIERSINNLQRKERHIMNKIAKLTGKADVEMDQNPVQMPQNNPGHDPNPNTRPFEHKLWRSARRVSPPPGTRVRAHPAPVAAPPKNDDNVTTEPAYKYAAQLTMLLEMGFEDITSCKKLLEEVNGDINQVAERIGRVPYI